MCSKIFYILIIVTQITVIVSEVLKTDQESFDTSSNLTENGSVQGISRSLEIFSVESLARNWAFVRKNLGMECEQDIQQLLKGLETGENWALTSKYTFLINIKNKNEK